MDHPGANASIKSVKCARTPLEGHQFRTDSAGIMQETIFFAVLKESSKQVFAVFKESSKQVFAVFYFLLLLLLFHAYHELKSPHLWRNPLKEIRGGTLLITLAVEQVDVFVKRTCSTGMQPRLWGARFHHRCHNDCQCHTTTNLAPKPARWQLCLFYHSIHCPGS
jgi:hypothetical protein